MELWENIFIMYRVTRQITFCYGHRLMNYAGKCRHVHGHNGRVEIVIASKSLDSRNMVVDFNDIKKTIQTWIDRNFDHKFLLRKDDPLLPVFKKHKEPFYVFNDNPTAEIIAREIYRYAKKQGLNVEKVILWETEKSSATYSEP
jgi:6-pyruvoyltetrahydropterin/6-carboxytetrahydropterin synthase